MLGSCATTVNIQKSDINGNLSILYEGKNPSNSLEEDLILIKDEKLFTLVAFSGRDDVNLDFLKDDRTSKISVVEVGD